MKVLLDECTPRLLQRKLPDFEIATVQELGWTGIKNGDLLILAEKEFDVFITRRSKASVPAESFGPQTRHN